jgi:hypothetical protein
MFQAEYVPDPEKRSTLTVNDVPEKAVMMPSMKLVGVGV